MELYCPICRSRLKENTRCNFCEVELNMEINLTPNTLPEFEQKILAK